MPASKRTLITAEVIIASFMLYFKSVPLVRKDAPFTILATPKTTKTGP